jgi:hypothetical protein
MRKLIIFNTIPLDSFFEGLNGEIDRHNVDGELRLPGIILLRPRRCNSGFYWKVRELQDV